MSRHDSRNDIRRLFQPRSVAVIGASDDPGRIGGRPVALMREHGYGGAIYPVNPKYRTVQGLPCFPDIASLPVDVDLYVICLPAEPAVRAVKEAGAHSGGNGHGGPAAVVFGGGFAETGEEGRALQAALRDAAAAHGVAVVGPNTVGLASFAHHSYPTFTTTLAAIPEVEPGDIALVSQSGGFAFNLFAESYAAGARFAHVVGSGNEAGLSFPDYLDYLVDDPQVASVIGYLEGTSDGVRLGRVLERLRLAGKPVFLLKSGASERGREAAATHTAQLSGDDQAWTALFERHGVTRLHSIDEVVDVARALSLGAARAEFASKGVAISTNSGGTAVYMADVAERFGVPLAPLAGRTRERLAEVLPAFAHVANPIDVTAQVVNDRTLLPRALGTLDEDPDIGLLLVFLGAMPDLADQFIDQLCELAPTMSTPLALGWAGVPESIRQRAAGAGLTVCGDPGRVLRGLGLARRSLARMAEAPGLAGISEAASPASVELPDDLLVHALPDGRLGLDEWQSMRLLEGRLAGRLPARAKVGTADEAAAAAEKIGYPVVAKVLEPFLPHRAKVDAVATALADAAEVRAAFETFVNRHAAREVLIAAQVAVGAELLAGVLADPVFGTRAVIGSGGVLANEIADVRTLVPPYDPAYLAGELSALRLAGTFAARRPLPAVAAELHRVLTALAAVVAGSGGRITSIECNPLSVTEDAVTVLDALAVLDDQQQQGS